MKHAILKSSCDGVALQATLVIGLFGAISVNAVLLLAYLS
jgi:hypothetical protein